MKTHQATVRSGRLVLDEPTELPEGTVVELLEEEDDEELSDEEWETLRPLLERSVQSANERRGQPIEQTLRKLASRK